MTNSGTGRLALLSVACFAAVSSAWAQSSSNYTVLVSASVQISPPKITISWTPDPAATGYSVSRKSRDAQFWGASTALPANATNFIDTNVAVGGTYEYDINKAASSYSADGYIYMGIQAPLVDSRGTVILVADNTQTTSLATELTRLQEDLVGDGWTVLRHDVARMAVDPANTSSNVWAARSNELASVKALIKADYNADPTNVKSVLLFGHVPVPYSGNLAPDGHNEHLGAWPADVFYGDMDGTWSDSSVTATGASDPRNINVPGDGKFDQSALPSDVALQVGRVDFANLPVFPQSETELLRQYLNKDHNFRQAKIMAQRRGLIDDNFGVFSGEAFAADGWGDFSASFGPSNIIAGDWLSTLDSQSFLWGYGCGPGIYTGATGVSSSTDFVTNDTQVVFTMLFGSFFGDWDSQNNFLRAQLGTATYTLTSAWAGRPYWLFHHMALGETIGFSTRVTQNNAVTYSANSGTRFVHIALMGDPTLRMHPVAPPASLMVVTNGSGGVLVSWNPSSDSVAGYHVYRAATAAGPFTRLTTNLINTTSYTDSAVSSNVYMVRAVKLELSASGTYFNPSQGIFQSLDGTAGAPGIVLFQPTNHAAFGMQPNVSLTASISDPANCVTDVVFYANGAKIGDAPAPPYSLSWSNVPGGVYSLSAGALYGGKATNSGTVTVGVDNGGMPRLSIIPLGNGSNAIRGDDILGRTYHLQYVTPGLTNWQTLGTATATASWSFQFIDSNTVPQRFYRSVFP